MTPYRVLVAAASRHGATREIAAMRAPVGDARDRAQVRAWAEELAASLGADCPAPTTVAPTGRG
ncbi:hypothetical protein [Blastococcus sp. SYSU DS1024]